MTGRRIRAAPGRPTAGLHRWSQTQRLTVSSMRRAEPMRVRTWRASLIVAAAVLAMSFAGSVESAAKSGVLHEALEPSLWGFGEETFNLVEILDGPSVQSPDVPSLFEEEVLALDGRIDLRTNTRAGLVGFAVKESPEQAFTLLTSELEGKGWSHIESGSEMCATFAKAGGTYHWVYLSCVRSATVTCVVVQVVPIEDEGV